MRFPAGLGIKMDHVQTVLAVPILQEDSGVLGMYPVYEVDKDIKHKEMVVCYLSFVLNYIEGLSFTGKAFLMYFLKNLSYMPAQRISSSIFVFLSVTSSEIVT